MNAIAYKSETKYELSLVVASVLTVLFLLYIDEGYYNFDWMNNIGAWIFFVEIVVFLATIQLLLFVFMDAVFKRFPIIIEPF